MTIFRGGGRDQVVRMYFEEEPELPLILYIPEYKNQFAVIQRAALQLSTHNGAFTTPSTWGVEP